jgi:hypothetical protein
MLSHFQVFHLSKVLSEMYQKYYLPYCTFNESKRQGGAKSREVTKKGKPIVHNDGDHEFIADLVRQIPSASLSKALMIYYQLLGHGIHEIRPVPSEPASKSNTPFAWIDHKTEPDENGNITAKITMTGPGGKKKQTAIVHTNIENLKNRLKDAGYDTNNQQALESFLKTPWKTWRKRIITDQEAPEGSNYNFKIKNFGADYHAKQVAESPDFNKLFQNDSEFRDFVVKNAVISASVATGVKATYNGGFDYEIKGGGKWGGAESIFDDVVQAAIMNLSNTSSSEPESLNNKDWVKQKLGSGAKDHVLQIRRSKETKAVGTYGDEPVVSDLGDDNVKKTHTTTEPMDFNDDTVDFEDIKDLEYELDDVKQKLKNKSLTGEMRQKIMNYGMRIEDQLEKLKAQKQLMAHYDKPIPVKPRIVTPELPDAQPHATSYSYGGDDDRADDTDLLKYRRRMRAEGFTFENYLAFKETMGATAAIYDGSKERDFQWEGNPKSMIKIRKRK